MFALTSTGKLALSEGNGRYRQGDGYYVSENLYDITYSKVYNMIQSAQNKGGNYFNEKLSAENIKVAFNQLRKSSYKQKPILIFEEKSKIMINADFINQHFEFNAVADLSSEPEFRIKTDLGNLLQEVFHKAYENKYTKIRDGMILGTCFKGTRYDQSTLQKLGPENYPFLLSIMKRRDNPRLIPTYNNTTSNLLQLKLQLPIQYEDFGSLYVFDTHPEVYFFKEHMGEDHRDLDDMFYKPVGECCKDLQLGARGAYPKGQADFCDDYRHCLTEDMVDLKRMRGEYDDDDSTNKKQKVTE